MGCRKLLAIGFVGWGVAYLIFGPSPPVVMMLEGVGVKTARVWVWVSLALSSLVYGQGVALTLIPLVPLIKSGATMEAGRRGVALEGEAELACPCARRPTTDDRRPLRLVPRIAISETPPRTVSTQPRARVPTRRAPGTERGEALSLALDDAIAAVSQSTMACGEAVGPVVGALAIAYLPQVAEPGCVLEGTEEHLCRSGWAWTSFICGVLLVGLGIATLCVVPPSAGAEGSDQFKGEFDPPSPPCPAWF